MQKAYYLLDFNKQLFIWISIKKVVKKDLTDPLRSVRSGCLDQLFLRDQLNRIFGKIGCYYICAGSFYCGELFQNNLIVI